MSNNIRMIISASIATVILTGLISLLYAPLEVNAGGGNFIKTVHGSQRYP